MDKEILENETISWTRHIKVFFYSKKVQRCFVLITLGFIAFLIMMYSKQSPWRKAESWTDSSVFRYVALEMSRGAIPYLDTFDHKGPLLYLINLLGQSIDYMRGIWLIEYAFMIGALAAMYKISRLFCGRVASCIAVLISSKWILDYFQYGNFTEEYAILPICLATYFFLDYLLNDKISRFKILVSGACLAAVVLLRANMIAVWLVFCVVIFIKCVVKAEWKRMGEFVLFFLCGMCAVFLPVFIWLGVNGAFDDFIQSYLVFNLTYSTEAGGRALTTAKWNSFVHFFNQDIVLYAVAILLYLFVKGKNRLLDGSYLIYVFLMFRMLSMSGMQYGHYGMTIVPMLVYPVARFIGEVENHYKEHKNPLVLALVLYILVPMTLPAWVNAVNNMVQVRENQENSNYSYAVRKAAAIIQKHTAEDERITVYGNWNIVYLISERCSASKYSYQFPIGTIDTSIMDRYFEEITEEQPKVVVVQADRLDSRMREFLDEFGYELSYNEKSDGSGSQVYVKQME